MVLASILSIGGVAIAVAVVASVGGAIAVVLFLRKNKKIADRVEAVVKTASGN